MAQHEITKNQAIALSYLQKVNTTYESNHAISRRLKIPVSNVRNSLIRLIKLDLVSERDDEGQRLLEVTTLGKKHLVILEEIGKGNQSWH